MNKLFYTPYAKEWLEALPLGNGRLGAMVYGEPFEGRIQMNEESVVYGGPIDRINPDAAKHFQKIRSLIKDGKIEEAEELSVYALSGTPQSQRPFQTLGEFSYRIRHGEGEISDYRRELDRDGQLQTGRDHIWDEGIYFSGRGRFGGGIFSGQAGLHLHVGAFDQGKIL